MTEENNQTKEQQSSESLSAEKQPDPGSKPLENENTTDNKLELDAKQLDPANKPLEDTNNKEADATSTLKPLIQVALQELNNQRNELQKELVDLTNRKSQLSKELNTTFAGKSDDVARKLKGFQDYLTGALQDLAQSAAQLELVAQPVVVQPSPLDEQPKVSDPEVIEQAPAIADTFKPDEELIRDCLQQFSKEPSFYADPWKFRRSLESQDISLLEDWFFSMGGRGAQPSRGNRPKNVLISAALISILGELYGDRFQTLVLASQPERLGEWRRGLQDALGLNREDFGPNSGIVLFERADGVIEKADRLEEQGDVPFILIDSCEQVVDIAILQFPIWLAFAATPQEIYAEEELI